MNEEVTAQESLPATLQEAYNSFIEDLNESAIPESDNPMKMMVIVLALDFQKRMHIRKYLQTLQLCL